MEGQIVRRSDQIAYVNHDIDDAIRAGILTNEDIPKSISGILGHTHSQRIDTFVCDLIATSREEGKILLSPPVDQALKDLRAFMFERVYRNPVAKGQRLLIGIRTIEHFVLWTSQRSHATTHDKHQDYRQP